MTSPVEPGPEPSAEERKVSALKQHSRQLSRKSLDRIRVAAATVFVRHGYSGATMEELAREAGVTRQTLYRHFPSKYDVALDFMSGAQDKALAVWLALERHDLSDRQSVRDWIQTVISHRARRPNFRVYVELASTEPLYRAVMAEEISQIIAGLGKTHPFFARAAANPSGLDWAKAHLFVATLMERSDFVAMGEEWFAAQHLEQIMADWLLALLGSDG